MSDQQAKTQPDGELAELIQSFSSSLRSLREFVDAADGVFAGRELSLVLETAELTPVREAALIALETNAAELVHGPVSVRLVERDGQEIYTFEISRKDGDPLSEAMKRWDSARRHVELFREGALMSLIGAAEWFLSRLLHEHFRRVPEAAKVSETPLTLNQLRSLGSFDDAVAYVISDHVEQILRGGLDSWLGALTKMGLSMGYMNEHKEQLVEVFQRRHVIVHNGGKLSTPYLRKVEASLREGRSLGTKLTVSKHYLEKAADLIEATFILIAAELWKKLAPNSEVRARTMIDIAADHLSYGKWAIAERLSDFVRRDKALSERSQLIGLVNYWQCKKWMGSFDDVESDVRKTDFSAKEDRFKLARMALLGDVENFLGLASVLIAGQRMDLEELDSSPLFQEIRTASAFDAWRTLIETGLAQPSDDEQAPAAAVVPDQDRN